MTGFSAGAVADTDPGSANLVQSDAVRALARDWSIEVTPKEMLKLPAHVADDIPKGTHVYITWLSGGDVGATVDAAGRLAALGMRPVPHLAARAIRDEAALADLLERLRSEAGVRKVLLVGGALARPVGRFDASIQVLRTGLLQRHGIECAGVGGHPEGSPDIDAGALAQALLGKNAYARDQSFPLEITTQFCFSADPVIAWERDIRSAGNGLPIAVGLAGLAGVSTLIRHARNCGVGSSIGVLLKQASKVLKLASAVEPSDVILGLARARQADPACRIGRLHFFPFGALAETVRYVRALADGRFELDEVRQRLVVSR